MPVAGIEMIGVAPGPTFEAIITATASKRVLTRSAGKKVAATPAFELVRAAIAEQLIVAGAAQHKIVAVAALQAIGTGRATQDVVSRAAVDAIGTVAATNGLGLGVAEDHLVPQCRGIRAVEVDGQGLAFSVDLAAIGERPVLCAFDLRAGAGQFGAAPRHELAAVGQPGVTQQGVAGIRVEAIEMAVGIDGGEQAAIADQSQRLHLLQRVPIPDIRGRETCKLRTRHP